MEQLTHAHCPAFPTEFTDVQTDCGNTLSSYTRVSYVYMGGSSPGTFSLPVAVLFSGLFLMEDEHAQGSPSLLSKLTCPPHLPTGLAGGCLVLALSQESRKTLFFPLRKKNTAPLWCSPGMSASPSVSPLCRCWWQHDDLLYYSESLFM